MRKGQLIHIPQDVYLLDELTTWFKTEKPIIALYWEEDKKEPEWASVYYNNKFWDVKNKDIYPLKERTNVS